MPEVCTEITEWIEEEVTRPVEEWVEKTENVCKNWPWPLNWICKAVTTLVKVVTYIVEVVGKWVTRTVCTIVEAIVTFVVDFFTGLWDIIAGIFTLDWARILDGLITIFTGIVDFIATIIRVVLLGDTIDFIISEWKEHQLKDYIRTLLEAKYSGEVLEEIKDALGIDHGAFGFRIKMQAIRTFVDSEYRSQKNMPPDLWQMHDRGEIDLYELCGFTFKKYFNRARYVALNSGLVISGGGGLLSGSEWNTISESTLKEYIDNRGESNQQFTIRSITESALDTKLSIAQEAGRDIGLIINWEKSLQEVHQLDHIIQTASDSNQLDFLTNVIGRKKKSDDLAGAITELCTPVAVSVFKYTDETLLGMSTTLMQSECYECADCGDIYGMRAHDTSGVTFRDRQPDFVFKYVPIHELGHYFGLCHIFDGLDRVMYKTNVSDWFSWRLIPEYVYFKGRAGFVLDEAKKVWEYIIANFNADCLRVRHE